MNKIKVLMLGPARDVKGGMTSVVNNYFEYGLDKLINLKYIETINDKNKMSKILEMLKGFMEFIINISKYDIVHIHMASRISTFRKGIYVRIAKKINKKVIIHIHGAEYRIFFEECNKRQKKYVRKTLSLADKIIVLSEEWKEYFSNIVDEKKIVVLYNSIILPNDFEKNTETHKFLFLGRIGKRKGIYDLIEVIERLLIDYPDIELYVGGDGEIEKVKKIIENKKMKNNVHILGWISGKQREKYLKECTFYVLPSYNEGMPMSVIEGMAYKNIVISTKVGGIPKVIQNKENGIIIEPGDKEKLYESINLLLNNTELRKKISNNARITVKEKFNIENNIKKLIEVYKNE